MQEMQQEMQKVFVPYDEGLPIEIAGLGELVPYQLEYRCLRMKDGTYEFLPVSAESNGIANQQAA